MSSSNPTVTFDGGTASNPSSLKGLGYSDSWVFEVYNQIDGSEQTFSDGLSYTPYNDIYFKTSDTDNSITGTFGGKTGIPQNIKTVYNYDEESVSYDFTIKNVLDPNLISSSATEDSISFSLTPSFDVNQCEFINLQVDLLVDNQIKKTKNTSIKVGFEVDEVTFKDIMSNVGFPVNSFAHSFVKGSLTYELCKPLFDTINANYLVGGDTTQKRFSTENHATSEYVNSETFFLSDYDFTGVAVWNSQGVNQRCGTMISPIHMIMAEHYPIANGETVRFVTKDNQVIERTVAQQLTSVEDIKIAVLDQEVPSSIKHYKIWDYHDHTFHAFGKSNPKFESKTKISRSAWEKIPTVGFDKNNKAFVMRTLRTIKPRKILNDIFETYDPNDYAYPFEFAHFYTDYNSNYLSLSSATNPESDSPFYQWITFSYTPVSGDSSKPFFFLFKDEPLLVGCFHTIDRSPSIASYKDYVNETMALLDDRYQLEFIDLSEFEEFPSFEESHFRYI